MFDLFAELRALVEELDRDGTPYALCGGLAMAVFGHARATVDIDLLVRSGDLEAVLAAAARRGFVVAAKPMTFSGGAMEIRRVWKVEAGDILMLDLLLVTDPLTEVWQQRERYELDGFQLSVVSRHGLIRLKEFRRSAQDLADIEKLSNDE